jgi:nitrite reductase/ring-hydroxylating ferredoxin subunit
MSWTKVLSVDSLSEGQREVVKVNQRHVLLLHKDGEIIAVDNTCPHMRLPLKNGEITEDDAIVCPWHHSAFDLHTGDVKQWSTWPPLVGKALSVVSKQKALPVYPVKVEAGNIWVDVGEE